MDGWTDRPPEKAGGRWREGRQKEPKPEEEKLFRERPFRKSRGEGVLPMDIHSAF